MIMRRKLYLIISDGGGNTPLRGVLIDKDNFLNCKLYVSIFGKKTLFNQIPSKLVVASLIIKCEN